MAFANCCFSAESNASTVRSVRLKEMVSTGMVVAVLIGAASGAGACDWHEGSQLHGCRACSQGRIFKLHDVLTLGWAIDCDSVLPL